MSSEQVKFSTYDYASSRAMLVPDYEDIPDYSFTATVTPDRNWGDVGDVEGSRWEFLVDGQPVTWEELTDDQRMTVRMARAWSGRVRDYWTDLEYEDEQWYVLEALELL